MSRLGRLARSLSVVALLSVALLPRLANGASAAGSGTRLWIARYNDASNGDDFGKAVATSPDGSKTYVTGSGANGGSNEYVTIAYDASTGAVLWQATYDGPDHLGGDARALAVSPDGSKVFVTGEVYGTAPNYDFGTVAYNAATGAKLWAKLYDDNGHHPDEPGAIAVSPDGSAGIVAGGAGPAPNYGYVTVAMDPSTGARLWVETYANIGDRANAVTVSPDSSKVFVTGISNDNYVTIAYDKTNGTKLWLTREPNTSHNGAVAVISSPDSSKLYVTGTAFDISTSRDLFRTVAYDSTTGSLVWQSLAGDDGDSASSMAMTPDGSKLFVTGTDSDSFNTTNTYDYATIAIATTDGHELWQMTAQGFFPDVPSVVTATSTRVFLGAELETSPRYSYIVGAYSPATGARGWSGRFTATGTGYRGTLAIVASADGSGVFATGTTYGTTVGGSEYEDLITAAFQS